MSEAPEQTQERPSLWLVLAMPASVAVVAFALVLGLALGVGLEDGGEVSPTTTEPTAAGAAVFTEAACGGCHTLSAAGATGTVGPSLDDTQLSEEELAGVIANGRRAMPAFSGRLSAPEIDAVAVYVAESAASAP